LSWAWRPRSRDLTPSIQPSTVSTSFSRRPEEACKANLQLAEALFGCFNSPESKNGLFEPNPYHLVNREMNLVALYARVSKDICRTCGRAEASHDDSTGHGFKGQDPEAQLQPLREMCRMRGWTVFREYVDQGWSGASESRPAFDELMAEVAAVEQKGHVRKFDGIVVWKFDRFFRSTKHMLQVLDSFEAKRLEFVSLTESIDTSSPIGRLLFTILAAIAEFERNLIAERIRNGMKKAGAKRPGPKVGVGGPSRSTLWRRNRCT
jgi:DNA invertase Pin-like site-specific DNA recombinase